MCAAQAVGLKFYSFTVQGEKKKKHPVSILKAWISKRFLSSCGCTQHVLLNEVQEHYQGLMWCKQASYLDPPSASASASASACPICKMKANN